MNKAMLRLSTGKRINSAADDPAGLCISQGMESQIRGMNVAKRNAQDAISMVQTADGALSSVHSILQKLNELAVQAANGSYTDDDRVSSNVAFQSLIKGIDEVLSKNGYDILLLSTNNDKEKEREQLKKLLEYNVVGAIIEPTASALGNTNVEYYEAIDRKNIPYLMINAAYDKKQQSYVSIDDEKGGYTICKYLIDLGHKKIAGLFKEDDVQGIERKNGYLKALEENNIEIDSTIIGKFKTFEEEFYIEGFTRSLLSKEEKPTAIFCYNDKVAMNVVKIAKELGVRIPEDLSVVGYDNDETISAALDCAITTISHPKEELGRKAAEMLLLLINGEKEKVSYVFEPEIAIKNSVKKIKNS